jgi:hypothetical protein
MVEVPGGWYPVDAEAVVLPAHDFPPVEVRRYPQLVGIESVPVGPVGHPWGDPRVLGGSQIAAALGPAWQELKLDRIVSAGQGDTGLPRQTVYEIFTRGGTRILWGRAPNREAPGEPDADEKIARLKRYFAEHGTLEGPRGPQVLDLREQPPAVPPATTAGRPSAAVQ